ncbi:hypothetical protein Tco_1157092 [Tanacetum coccineum]
MSMSVQKSQVHKTVTRSQDDDKRLCLVDDLKEVQVHIQVKLYGTSSSLKSKITTSCSQDENDNDVISAFSSVEQDGGTVEQHPANVEETQAAKFVRDLKSLAEEADESLAKHKALEFEIEHLLRAVVSQDTMSIVQSNSVVDTSNL